MPRILNMRSIFTPMKLRYHITFMLVVFSEANKALGGNVVSAPMSSRTALGSSSLQ